MNSHDVGRDRGGVELALKKVTCPTLVLGVDSDRLFPVSGQELIAKNISGPLVGGELQLISSEYGHDGFLIESKEVGARLKLLLA
jgi:Homoserine acetyltransferase